MNKFRKYSFMDVSLNESRVESFFDSVFYDLYNTILYILCSVTIDDSLPLLIKLLIGFEQAQLTNRNRIFYDTQLLFCIFNFI